MCAGKDNIGVKRGKKPDKKAQAQAFHNACTTLRDAFGDFLVVVSPTGKPVRLNPTRDFHIMYAHSPGTWHILAARTYSRKIDEENLGLRIMLKARAAQA